MAHATVRPRGGDLQYSVKELARALAVPTRRDWQRLKRVARYSKGKRSYEMIFEVNTLLPLVIKVFADASFANQPHCKIATGFVIQLQGITISLGSKTQATIALSTGEAELLALNTAVAEALFVQNILLDLGYENVPVPAFTDSSAALGTVSRQAGRVKHVHFRELWLQQFMKQKWFNVEKIPRAQNLADMMTHQLTAKEMPKASRRIGLVEQ